MDSLAAVDWTAYETEALAAIGAAHTEQELDHARVKYFGRKSELAQALRGVRDRESGILL
ncbi:MAG: Aminoacyl tRNA synthetase class N-terminal domain, partial [Gaiellaceae bacterium]|nr:Aminoacyl tRNA synthetase class N-terminal domain [Gaiellaceae bacterium]